MSDEKPEDGEAERQLVNLPLTEQDQVAAREAIARVLDFNAKKNVKQECPMCGSGVWAILEFANVEPGLAFFRVIAGGDVVSQRIATYSFACDNCGFIRSHVRSLVDEDE